MKQSKTLVMAVTTAVGMLIGQSAIAAEGETVDAIKDRGVLLCGVSTGTRIGGSTLDDKGNWKGLEVDFCQALAAAILGDGDKVQYVPLVWKNVFSALQSAKVDLLARGATHTFQRDSELRFEWPGIYFYDGITFLVSKASGIETVNDMDGASICVSPGSTNEAFMSDYFRANGMTVKTILADRDEQHRANLEAGRCDAINSELGGLAASRTVLKNPDDYVVLPQLLTKEPQGPTIRQSDPLYTDIVKWTVNLLISAEENGVTQANVEELSATTENPEVARMLGKTGDLGAKLGLSNDWAVNVIKAVGNYGEIFDRNYGAGSPIGLERGLNELWSNGGLIYSPPFR